MNDDPGNTARQQAGRMEHQRQHPPPGWVVFRPCPAGRGGVGRQAAQACLFDGRMAWRAGSSGPAHLMGHCWAGVAAKPGGTVRGTLNTATNHQILRPRTANFLTPTITATGWGSRSWRKAAPCPAAPGVGAAIRLDGGARQRSPVASPSCWKGEAASAIRRPFGAYIYGEQIRTGWGHAG